VWSCSECGENLNITAALDLEIGSRLSTVVKRLGKGKVKRRTGQVGEKKIGEWMVCHTVSPGVKASVLQKLREVDSQADESYSDSEDRQNKAVDASVSGECGKRNGGG